MEYIYKVLGGFDPQEDEHAAVKFCLDSVVMDGRIGYLAQLLTEGSRISGFGADPGWFLERHVDGDPAQANWPPDAVFRASVDPDGYELGYPEGFYSREEFSRYVLLVVNAYVATNPSRASEVAPVLAALKADPLR